MRGKTTLVAMVLFGLVSATRARAVPADAQKCEAAKLSASAKFAACRLLAVRRAVILGGSPDYSQCDALLTRKWQQAEARFGAACPTLGDQSPRQAEAVADTAAIAQRLSATRPGCGDSVKNGSEQCDGADLGGASCTSLGYVAGGTLGCTAVCEYNTIDCARRAPATGQTLCWDTSGAPVPCGGTGHDGDVQAGGPLAYVDNGDGTITDINTGLMWEKKSRDGGMHDAYAAYDWDGAFAFVALLNTSNFAGHNDWRLPNVKELLSIVSYHRPYPGPAVAAAFNTGCAAGCSATTCSCTAGTYYSSTGFPQSNYVWWVDFGNGRSLVYDRTTNLAARAVRGM